MCEETIDVFSSESENRETYGKCNNSYGHGHNYVFKGKFTKFLESNLLINLPKTNQKNLFVLNTVDRNQKLIISTIRPQGHLSLTYSFNHSATRIHENIRS